MALIKMLKSRDPSPIIQKSGTERAHVTRNLNMLTTFPRKLADIKTDWEALKTNPLALLNKPSIPSVKII